MTGTTTTRRTMLGAIAVAPIAVLPAAAMGATTSAAFAGLSPLMREAVAAWAAASSTFADFSGDAEECNTLCRACHTHTCAVAAVPAKTLEDLAVKTYLLALVECSQNGPQSLVHEVDPEDAGYEETHLWSGIIRDLPLTSPAVRALIAGEA